MNKDKICRNREVALLERLEFINEFFDNLSIEEFEQMVFELSSEEIKENYKSE